MVQCTQPTDCVQIEGEFPLQASKKPSATAKLNRGARAAEDLDLESENAAGGGPSSSAVAEPLLQWRWAHSELTFVASASEIEVVIMEPGSAGFSIVMSSAGFPVIRNLASSHDPAGGANAAVVKRCVWVYF